MSKTKIKNRKKANLVPTEKTGKLLFNYQSHLFALSQRINKSEASEHLKTTELNDIFLVMEKISKQLIKRGYQTNTQYEAN